MIPEALMLNFLDDMDAKMQTLASEFQKATRQGKSPEEMTDRIWALDQRSMLNSSAWLAEAKNLNSNAVTEVTQPVEQGKGKQTTTMGALFEDLGFKVNK
jgi:3'-5' exoribonuclease